MKITPVLYMLPIVAMLAANPVQAAGKGGSPGVGIQPVQPIVTPLSDAEAAMLTFMREEEKLSRDLYLIAFDLWGDPVFDNIAAAEQRHMDSMKLLLDRYGLVDPVLDDTVGVLGNADVVVLYEELTTRSALSLEEALHAAAYNEELDMIELQQAIAGSTHADVTKAYENLLRGSRNHLRVFVAQIEGLGIVYEAQVLTQDEVDEIVNSDMERGGNGSRKGQGGR
ncbi:DUF2202 domain-containing protein [Thiolapillus sp.]